MSVEQIISGYGYYAVFLFACIEGEIALITAGFLAHQGLLSIQLVVLYAFLGTFLMEQGVFQVGRIYGLKILDRFPKVKPKVSTVFKWLKRYDSLFIFSFRFVYGVRNISPLIIGASGVPSKKFFFINFFAAIVWSIVIACTGYVFSNAIEGIIALFGQYQKYVLFAILGTVVLIYIAISFRQIYLSRKR
ncbi:MAG: DedA family protein [Holosporales bacterium]|jgi:membrane protein DedA with SNARE-associated domain|nr:DedA family protein [Holosporales bacterium]